MFMFFFLFPSPRFHAYVWRGGSSLTCLFSHFLFFFFLDRHIVSKFSTPRTTTALLAYRV